MQLGMLLMLIVPAWSLAFWQAWLYWILSSAAAFATALYFLAHDRALMQRRLGVGARAESLPSQKLIQGVGGAFVAAIYVVAGIEHRFDARDTAGTCGVEQRRQTTRRAVLHARLAADLRLPVVGLRSYGEVAALRDQKRHHLRMILRGRPHHG